ncbi:MAG: Hsp20/alpha crystallin family protein [Patescibacteria group bacterium]|nr:Hsp20/alpha crystallin family protein [Patescibacteria group bacterium]
MRKILQKLSGFNREKQNFDLQDETENEDGTNEDDLYYDNDDEHEENEEEENIEDESETDQLQKELDEEWPADEFEEGQLSIDVYQTAKSIVVKSTIAGVKPGDIDISINNDMLTIRGKREYNEKVEDENYLFRECYWGAFSRSVILPVEVESEKIDATLENGVLTITLPKAKNAQQIQIKVKEKS